MLKNYSKFEVNQYGSKRYFNNKGDYHRLDGPAVEWLDGSKLWYINRNSHRNIGPSCEFSDGEKRWRFKDDAHRVGGLYNPLCKAWHIHGKEYTKEDYFNKVWDI